MSITTRTHTRIYRPSQYIQKKTFLNRKQLVRALYSFSFGANCYYIGQKYVSTYSGSQFSHE